MTAQTVSYSPEFQALITQVETALVQAAADARELAERTGTPLVVRERGGIEPAAGIGAEEKETTRNNRSKF
jgi:hypothetical protein